MSVKYNPFSLEGKAILVTGASSGIGMAVALESSKCGASLFITGRDKERLERTFNSLDGLGHSKIIADLTDEVDLDNLISAVPSLDGIVFSAGITMAVPFKFITKEKLNHIFNLNFNSAAVMTQRLLQNKLIKREASIVFISSISGVYCSSPGASIYSASKGAINGLAKGLALDLSHTLIRVNTVCPGMVETNIYGSGQITEEQLEEDRKRYPLKRYGKPEEVAFAVIYLLSDASKWVTGSNLLIDGGFTLL